MANVISRTVRGHNSSARRLQSPKRVTVSRTTTPAAESSDQGMTRDLFPGSRFSRNQTPCRTTALQRGSEARLRRATEIAGTISEPLQAGLKGEAHDGPSNSQRERPPDLPSANDATIPRAPRASPLLPDAGTATPPRPGACPDSSRCTGTIAPEPDLERFVIRMPSSHVQRRARRTARGQSLVSIAGHSKGPEK